MPIRGKKTSSTEINSATTQAHRSMPIIPESTPEIFGTPQFRSVMDINNAIYTSKLGNYYSHTGSGTNGDGIGENPYTTTPLPGSLQKQDLYPLTDSNMTYAVQAWYFAENQIMTAEPNQPGFLQTLAGNDSIVWISDAAAREEIVFAALNSADGWNGQIRFSNSPAGNTIQIQVGSVDPVEGTFIAGGPSATLDGTGPNFTYKTTGQTFSVNEGHHLAVKITNTSAAVRQIFTGGAWTFISAPAGTQTPWPGVPNSPRPTRPT